MLTAAVAGDAPVAADAADTAASPGSDPFGQPGGADEDGTGTDGHGGTNGSGGGNGSGGANWSGGATGSEGYGAPLVAAASAATLPVASPAPALATVTTAPATATVGPATHNGSADPNAQSDADWAAAQSAAADWAAGQLALAGVPSKSGPGSSNPAAVTKGGLPAYTVRGIRRLIRVLLALMAALVLLAVLTVVGVTLGTGSSLSGGAGDNSFAPANLSAVQSHYRLGAGRLDLNLGAVTFPASGKTVNVTVGLGRLTVEVPKNTVIDLQARTGLGQVNVFGQTGSNLQETYYTGTGPTPPGGAPHLNLDAHVGMGYLQISQG
jgi:hypothetical protein